MAVSVTDVFSNPDPHIRRALKTLGTSEQRWSVFKAVYRGKKKRKSVEEIMTATELSRKQVLMAGKPLERARLIHQETGSPVSYTKIDEIIHIRDDILRAKNARLETLRKAKTTTKPLGRTSAARRSRRVAGKTAYQHDVFISHASEDKEPFVRGLANEIRDAGISVWYDEFSLEWGDRLRASIDRGLLNSRYGIVVLSPDFFRKDWPQDELEGLFALEQGGETKILPIWHNLTCQQVAEFSPMLAGRMAVISSEPLGDVIRKLKSKLGR